MNMTAPGVLRLFEISLALVVYAAASVLLFYRPGLVDGSGYFGNGPDPFLYIWMLRFLPAAIAHLQNPLVLAPAWAPFGLNITQATTTPFLALVMWPLTALVGPVVAFNILTLAIPPLGAAAAFWLMRALTERWGAAFIGGWIFGYSSAVFAPLQRHLQTDFVIFIPLVFLVLVSRLRRGISFWACVLALMLLGICQFLTSLETYVTLTIFAFLFAGVAQITKPGGMAMMFARAPDNLLAPLVLACAGTAMMVSPFIYYFFADYDQIPHLLQGGGYYSTDLLNLIVPTKTTWLGGDFAWPVSRHFAGNLSEQFGYVGLPLMVITAIAARDVWRTKIGGLVIVTMLVAVIFSLGPQLEVMGWGSVHLPWILMAKLPLLENALPARMMIFVMLFMAVVCAMWLSRLGRFYRLGCLLMMAAAAMMLPATRQGGDAQFWYSPLHRGAFFENGVYRNYIAPGGHVLFLPFFHDGTDTNGNGDAMLWQAETGGYFSMINGYGNFIPPPLDAAPAVEILRANKIVPAEPRLVTIFDVFMKANNVRYIIVEPYDMPQWEQFLRAAGWDETYIGDVWFCSMPDGAWAGIVAPRGPSY